MVVLWPGGRWRIITSSRARPRRCGWHSRRPQDPAQKPRCPAFHTWMPCGSATMKQYYRDGTFDSCGGTWGELFRCISLKTKSAADIEAILKEQEAAKQKQHIWRYRTEEEASDHWQQQFGHLQK
ncbi:unnamed protein product [Calypogeia fissa]